MPAAAPPSTAVAATTTAIDRISVERSSVNPHGAHHHQHHADDRKHRLIIPGSQQQHQQQSSYFELLSSSDEPLCATVEQGILVIRRAATSALQPPRRRLQQRPRFHSDVHLPDLAATEAAASAQSTGAPSSSSLSLPRDKEKEVQSVVFSEPLVLVALKIRRKSRNRNRLTSVLNTVFNNNGNTNAPNRDVLTNGSPTAASSDGENQLPSLPPPRRSLQIIRPKSTPNLNYTASRTLGGAIGGTGRVGMTGIPSPLHASSSLATQPIRHDPADPLQGLSASAAAAIVAADHWIDFKVIAPGSQEKGYPLRAPSLSVYQSFRAWLEKERSAALAALPGSASSAAAAAAAAAAAEGWLNDGADLDDDDGRLSVISSGLRPGTDAIHLISDGRALLKARREADESNLHCANCGADNPDWVAIEKRLIVALIVCERCSGIYRGMENYVVRSFLYDVTVFKDPGTSFYRAVSTVSNLESCLRLQENANIASTTAVTASNYADITGSVKGLYSSSTVATLGPNVAGEQNLRRASSSGGNISNGTRRSSSKGRKSTSRKNLKSETVPPPLAAFASNLQFATAAPPTSGDPAAASSIEMPRGDPVSSAQTAAPTVAPLATAVGAQRSRRRSSVHVTNPSASVPAGAVVDGIILHSNVNSDDDNAGDTMTSMAGWKNFFGIGKGKKRMAAAAATGAPLTVEE